MKTENIFKLSAAKLKKALYHELLDNGYTKCNNNAKFLYAEGDAPYMLIAHLDTVHKTPPSIICYSKNCDYMMSPQGIGGDDRCGVYIILQLLKKLEFRPHIVFTMDEEIGGIGADAFADYIIKHPIPELKYIVEYDRKGNKDCVFYSCANDEFVKFVEKFGFKEAYGTFSDISVIAPALGVAAVNLSSGYYNPHTQYEYVSFNDMEKIIKASVKMFNAESDKFEYVARYTYLPTSYKSDYFTYKDKTVCFLPKGTIYVYSPYIKGYVANKEYEIAFDENLTFYKYSEYYDDLSTISKDHMYFADPSFVPQYIEEEAITIPLIY